MNKSYKTVPLAGNILCVNMIKIKSEIEFKSLKKNHSSRLIVTLPHHHFQSHATRLYTPHCRSVGPLVRRSVSPSVRPSIGPLHLTFFGFLRSLASMLLPK